MKIYLSKPRGFCAGVERAIDTVKEALKMYDQPIYVKHHIVHNKHVVKELEELGATFVEEVSEIPDHAIVIYSAHGVSPQVRAEAKAKNLFEIDATCGLVTRVHSAVKRYAQKGYHILLIGHKNHVEIIGTKGEAEASTTVVESTKDVEKLSFSQDQKLFYITQTTLSVDDVKDIKDALIQKFPQIESMPTSSICYATTNRQMALKEISQHVDVVIVVGDTSSSNSNRLREVAERYNIPAYLVQSKDDITPNMVDGVVNIGMSAGASTPETIVQGCIDQLQKFGADEVEEVEWIKEDVFFQLPSQVLEKASF